MVDEDVVIGYILGYSSASSGGGSDTEEIKKAFESGYRLGYDDGYRDGKDGGSYDDRPPELTSDDAFKPTADNADYPYLIAASSDGRYHQVMYSIVGKDSLGTFKAVYVDLYVNNMLARHDIKQTVYDYPLNSLTIESDGKARVVIRKSDGTVVNDTTYGPYINSTYTTVWAI